MAQGKSEKQGGRRAINKLRCHPEVLHLVDPLADVCASVPASMKRPTANVSGDNPGDSAPVAGDERNQTLYSPRRCSPSRIFPGLAPPIRLPGQRTSSGNYRRLSLCQGDAGDIIPPAIPFRCSVKCAIHTYLRICRYCRYIKASGEGMSTSAVMRIFHARSR